MKNPNGNDLCNNLIRYYQLQRHMDLHNYRIQNVSPTLKAQKEQTNRSAGHIKKQPLAQFNRIMTIDIQNKALLKKLTNKSPSKIGKDKPYKLIKNNRRKNFQEYKKKLQNEGLLKRIKQAKSSYQNTKYTQQRKVTEGYINTISKFGYKNYVPNKTIMIPFYQREQSRLIKHNHNFEQFENQKKENLSFQRKHQQFDHIVKIQKKIWRLNQLKAEITYILWSKKISIQIDAQDHDIMCLQIPKNVFQKNFDSQLRILHRNIKYDSQSKQFFLDFRGQQNV